MGSVRLRVWANLMWPLVLGAGGKKGLMDFLWHWLDFWKCSRLLGAVVVEQLWKLQALCISYGTLHTTPQQPLTPEKQGIALPLSFQALTSFCKPREDSVVT